MGCVIKSRIYSRTLWEIVERQSCFRNYGLHFSYKKLSFRESLWLMSLNLRWNLKRFPRWNIFQWQAGEWGKIHQSAQLCSLGAFGQVTVSEDMMYLLFICSHHGMKWSMAQDYSTETSTLILFSCSNPEKQFRNQLSFFMPIWYADKNKFTSSSSYSVAAIISYPLGTTKKGGGTAKDPVT